MHAACAACAALSRCSFSPCTEHKRQAFMRKSLLGRRAGNLFQDNKDAFLAARKSFQPKSFFCTTLSGAMRTSSWIVVCQPWVISEPDFQRICSKADTYKAISGSVASVSYFLKPLKAASSNPEFSNGQPPTAQKPSETACPTCSKQQELLLAVVSQCADWRTPLKAPELCVEGIFLAAPNGLGVRTWEPITSLLQHGQAR